MTSLLAHVRFQGRLHRSSVRTERPAMEGKLAVIDRRRTPVILGHDEAQLCEAVLTRAGMGVSDLRSAPLARRIHAVLRTLRVRDPRQAVALVEQSAESHRRALAALLIGHTVAFRDESVFSSIRRFVIPRLAARPRVWSLGCSRGLELLSILLLLEERAIVPSAIRGSDLRPLDPGSDSTLARDLVRDAPTDFAELAARATPEWVRDRVQAIDWRRENVLVAEFDAGWDLILCRNLAIYLEPEAAASLWLRLASALKPGGFLIVGKAERPLVPGLHRCGPCIYQRPQRAGGLHGE